MNHDNESKDDNHDTYTIKDELKHEQAVKLSNDVQMVGVELFVAEKITSRQNMFVPQYDVI